MSLFKPKFLGFSNASRLLGRKTAGAGGGEELTASDVLTILSAPTKAELQNGGLIYAADAGSTDAYAIALTPAPSVYTTGMVVHFKANTANTGVCTLNVNSLGAVTIKKQYNIDLADADIKAGQLCSVIYDGTNFQLLSPVSNAGSASSPTLYRIASHFSTASTILVDVTGLSAPLGANKKYLIQGLLIGVATSPNGITMVVPYITNSLFSLYRRHGVAGGVIEDNYGGNANNNIYLIDNIANSYFISFQMLIVMSTTAGDWKIQIQESAGGGGTVYCSSGSYFTVQEVQ